MSDIILSYLVNEWLHLQAEAFKRRDLPDILRGAPIRKADIIESCSNISFVNAVHLNDVRPIAELLGLSVQKTKRDDSEYNAEYSFYYEDVKFMSIHSEK